MKVKEIERTANISWSPSAQHPVYVAAATAAQQLDATFSTSAALEIYTLQLSEPGMQMERVGTIPSDCRFHKLVWGNFGMSSADTPAGHLVGGADNGSVFVWNPQRIIDGGSALIHKLEKHVGAVAALDINTFQPNLMASGASDSEIFIWDLNNPSSPMTPGTKSQPPDDVTCIAWNKQVQHILASTYAGRCVVWDLRKNEPIIKVSDSMSRIKCKLVCWHPDVATQMCLASEDDHTPVIQLWDLRFATSPLKTLENHTRGVLSMAWCPQDADLLLSCGKDNRILCWNPNSQAQTGEVVYELPTSDQWSFDVQWCPRNPGIISTCSFDGHISIYSLMGGVSGAQASARGTANKIDESFPVDPFAQSQPQPQTPEIAPALKKPPKWLRRPVGASFGFGGKFLSFENTPANSPRLVSLSQVVLETELVSRSEQLEQALAQGRYAEFCAMKSANSQSNSEQDIWDFLKVHFEKDARSGYLSLLGYSDAELQAVMQGELSKDGCHGVDAGQLAHRMALLNGTASQSTDGESLNGDATAAFDAIADNEVHHDDAPLSFPTQNDADGVITRALLMADFDAAVRVCVRHNKMAEAILLAIAGGPQLLARTQKVFFESNTSCLSNIISSVLTRDFEKIMRTCQLENWKEALAVALTYAKAEEFSSLCDILGTRLETERNGAMAADACLCYVCAGNIDRLVRCCSNCLPAETPLTLQDLVEKIVVLQKATKQTATSGVLADKLSQYAGLLAAQGRLQTAYGYLTDSSQMPLAMLRDRLFHALGQSAVGGRAPPKPFQVIDVKGTKQPVHQTANTHHNTRRSSAGYFQNQHVAAPTERQRTTSGNYYTQPQPQPSPSYDASSPSYYNPASHYPSSTTTPTYASSGPSQFTFGQTQPATISKGPLAHKYPATAYSQNSYETYPQQPAQQPAYTGYGSSAYGPTSNQPVSQPQMFDPNAASNQVPAYTTMASSQPAPLSYQESRPTSSWNDPPAVKEKKREVYDAPAPITQPIFGAPVDPMQGMGAPGMGAPAMGAQGYRGGDQVYSTHNYQQQPQQMPQPAPEPPKPVVKAAIPSENVILQEILNKLAEQCMCSTTNPQIKRKLEDVLRKLEALYDKLREQSLPESVVYGLHQLVQAVQRYDYNAALAFHSHMVSQANFSQVSSFMPGIKVLMQTALMLQVYV